VFKAKFGVEVEFTGLTRREAAKTAREVLGGSIEYSGGNGSNANIVTPDNRVWKFVDDGSISPQRKQNQHIVTASHDHRVELVSPILIYHEDINIFQSLIRKLRKSGGFAPNNAGIHIHLDGSGHTPRSICNFVKIIASKNDLLYKSLQIKPERVHYCKKIDERLVADINRIRPDNFQKIADIWYQGYNESSHNHYHHSRYHFLNLHSFFTGNHTVELRGFNSELHAGKVRSYIVLALALNHQALTQKNSSSRKVQEDNDKFAMRTYLNRIGLIGDEFKTCRDFLCQHLSGNGAWRFGKPERGGNVS
jgi:hypothetical protein